MPKYRVKLHRVYIETYHVVVAAPEMSSGEAEEAAWESVGPSELVMRELDSGSDEVLAVDTIGPVPGDDPEGQDAFFVAPPNNTPPPLFSTLSKMVNKHPKWQLLDEFAKPVPAPAQQDDPSDEF